MRKALEFEITAQPAAANFGSISRAIAASTLANTIFGAPSGSAGDTTIFAIRSGSGVSKRHLAASPYGFPLDRSLAATQVTSNQGWFSSN